MPCFYVNMKTELTHKKTNFICMILILKKVLKQKLTVTHLDHMFILVVENEANVPAITVKEEDKIM